MLNVLTKHMVKTAVILSLFAFVGTGLVAFTQQQTRGKILAAERKVFLRNLHAVLDPQRYNNNIITDLITVENEQYLGSKKPVPVFRARRDGQPVALIISPVAPDGYNGGIKLLVAVNYDGSVAGVRVLDHRETPGLGDYIEERRSDWIYGFDNKSIGNPGPKKWKVKRDGGDFDQFTGATITPRAIVKAVHKTLQYVQQNQASLYAQASPVGKHKSEPPGDAAQPHTEELKSKHG